MHYTTATATATTATATAAATATTTTATTTTTTTTTTTLHYTTRHDTTPHHTTRHDTDYTTLHSATLHYTNYTALQLQLHYLTLDYTTLYHTTLHYTTLHDITLHYTNYTAPRLQLQLRLQFALITLHYSYSSTALHYNYSYNCNYNCNYTALHPAVVVRWPLRPLQPFQKKTQLQPPVGPSVDLLCHPWFTTTSLSYRLPIFETSAAALCGTDGIKTSLACLAALCKSEKKSFRLRKCFCSVCSDTRSESRFAFLPIWEMLPTLMLLASHFVLMWLWASMLAALFAATWIILNSNRRQVGSME